MQANKAFDAVCEQLSLLYADKGWKYAKSRHWMTRKDKHLTYKIYFYTNWNNVSDQNVGFYGECALILNSSKNKIFTMGTHHCNVPPGKLYWNIADQQNWSQAIGEFSAWIDEVFMPIVQQCHHHLDSYVGEVVQYGFYSAKGYQVDISFILQLGSRELAEVAAQRLYDGLEEAVKQEFKVNYESLMQGGEAVSAYGRNGMRNYSNFRTIIENHIIVNV